MKTMMFKRADRDSMSLPVKTVNGKYMVKIAEQRSPRLLRQSRVNHIYYLEGTQEIYYNRSRDGIIFIPMGFDSNQMKKYTDVFVTPPLTDKEKQWMATYSYIFTTK